MKKVIFGALVVIATVFCVSVPTQASLVINFDDLSTPNNDGGQLWGSVPSNYQGFTWAGSWEVAEQNSYKTTYGNSYNFPSQYNAAYNDTGSLTMTLTSSTPFNFESALFSTYAQNNSFASFSATTLTITGYLNNVAVGSPITFNLKSNMFESQSINLNDIDKVTFTANGAAKWWLMDNLTYTPVPIPAAVWLLGTGLIGLVGLRRNFQR